MFDNRSVATCIPEELCVSDEAICSSSRTAVCLPIVISNSKSQRRRSGSPMLLIMKLTVKGLCRAGANLFEMTPKIMQVWRGAFQRSPFERWRSRRDVSHRRGRNSSLRQPPLLHRGRPCCTLVRRGCVFARSSPCILSALE
jgi:hypothetical protein